MSRHRRPADEMSVGAAHLFVAMLITAAAVCGFAIVWALRVGILALVVM
ncbi:hypothetical protein [Nocardia asteroides]